ncbi:MAG: hypothetical protein WC942_10050, partial [Clostridia bacterium]
MLTLNKDSLFPQIGKTLQLSWTVENEEFDYFNLEYSFDEIEWYLIVSDLTTTTFSWVVPQAITSSIYIRVIGYRREVTTKVLLATTSTLQVFSPTGEIVEAFLEVIGDREVVETSLHPITSCSMIDIDKYLYTLSSIEKKYSISDDADIAIVNNGEESIAVAFISKLNEQFPEELLATCVYNGISQICIKENNSIRTFNITPTSSSYLPEAVEQLCPKYIPRYATYNPITKTILYSLYKPDKIYSTTTDSTGYYETPRMFFPVSNIGIGLGREVDISREVNSNYLWITKTSEPTYIKKQEDLNFEADVYQTGLTNLSLIESGLPDLSIVGDRRQDFFVEKEIVTIPSGIVRAFVYDEDNFSFLAGAKVQCGEDEFFI